VIRVSGHDAAEDVAQCVIAAVRDTPNAAGHGFGPSGFVKIVVHYDARTGAIVTAFPRRRFP